MLNRDVCKRCIEKSGITWTELFYERNWENDIVSCPNDDMVYIFKDPPAHCPHALEHMVLNDAEQNDM